MSHLPSSKTYSTLSLVAYFTRQVLRAILRYRAIVTHVEVFEMYAIKSIIRVRTRYLTYTFAFS